jgi:4-amino-4-deoxy-L-arabinose transferase-like glycosyltransferase
MTDSKWRYFFTILPIVLFGILACMFLDKPGLQNDEILFANVSLGEINQSTYIARKIGGITVFVISYIGALKSWLFAIIFKIFGFNHWSIRVPMILLGMFSLYWLHKAIRISFENSLLALAVLMAVASEPTYITMTRTDVGPIAIEYFCKVFSIYLIFKYLKNKNKKFLYFLPIILALGVFNKINFIWFSNALIFGSVVLLFLIKTKKDKYTFLRLLGLTFIIEFALFIAFNKLNPGMVRGNITLTPEAMIKKLELFYYYGKGIFDGTGFYKIQYLISEETFGFNTISKGIYSLFFYLFELSLAFVIVNLAVTLRKLFRKEFQETDIYFLFFCGLILLISAQIFIVENARNLWHYYTLFPFFTICSIFSFYKFLGKKPSTVYVTIICIYNLNSYSTYLYALQNKVPNPFWSNKITELAEYIRPISGEFVELDWGMSSQLLCLTKEDKFKQAFLTQNGSLLTTEKEPETVFYNEQIRGKDLSNLYFVTYQSQLADPEMNAIMDLALTKYGYQKILVKDFLENNRSKIYSIFRLKKV